MLILVDRFALPRLAAIRMNFYVSLARTRMVFQGNLSAYENEVNRSSENVKALGLVLGEITAIQLAHVYTVVLPALYLLVPDFHWALALWLAVEPDFMCYFTFSYAFGYFQ